MVQLSHLKRKLVKDDKYRERYVKFMNDIIEKEEAEEAHDQGTEGEKWYISHQGVYHSEKPDKLWVGRSLIVQLSTREPA